MLINAQSLDLTFKGFKAVYTDAFIAAPAHADKIAMTVPSGSRDETYGWLGAFPSLREWVGPRHVLGLEAHSFTIKNRLFESTVSVSRNDISDDRLGVFKPVFATMGQEARRHPEELVFGLLKSGFASPCYDGQFFFDADHPVMVEGAMTQVTNMQAGSGPGWYLLDTSQAVRPIIWQERETYQFESKTRNEDDNVFMDNEYMYGVRARVNAGFGLWQLAFGSKAVLNAANYAAARAAMMSMRGDGGRILGVNPTTLVVPPALESDALNVVNTEFGASGASNPWKGTADLIVTPYLV